MEKYLDVGTFVSDCSIKKAWFLWESKQNCITLYFGINAYQPVSAGSLAIRSSSSLGIVRDIVPLVVQQSVSLQLMVRMNEHNVCLETNSLDIIILESELIWGGVAWRGVACCGVAKWFRQTQLFFIPDYSSLIHLSKFIYGLFIQDLSGNGRATRTSTLNNGEVKGNYHIYISYDGWLVVTLIRWLN